MKRKAKDAAAEAVARRGITLGTAQGARMPRSARLSAQAAIRSAMTKRK